MSIEDDPLVWDVVGGVEHRNVIPGAAVDDQAGLQGDVDLLKLARTRHWLTRKGAEMRVRVLPVAGPDGGQAVIIGDVELRAESPLVRIHSRCLYGDALQSDDCDCGPELEKAMDRIQLEGAGVLLYLEQEGRGAGLEVKARGLGLTQALGYDTFAAYDELGYEHDYRSYDTAAKFLHDLGLHDVRLLTNNPEKVVALCNRGIDVTQVLLHTEPRSEAARSYLRAKRIRRGHLLPEDSRWRVGRFVLQAWVFGIVISAVVGIWCAPRAAAILCCLLLVVPIVVRRRLRWRIWLRHLRGGRHKPVK